MSPRRHIQWLVTFKRPTGDQVVPTDLLGAALNAVAGVITGTGFNPPAGIELAVSVDGGPPEIVAIAENAELAIERAGGGTRPGLPPNPNDRTGAYAVRVVLVWALELAAPIQAPAAYAALLKAGAKPADTMTTEQGEHLSLAQLYQRRLKPEEIPKGAN